MWMILLGSITCVIVYPWKQIVYFFLAAFHTPNHLIGVTPHIFSASGNSDTSDPVVNHIFGGNFFCVSVTVNVAICI